jgi:protein SCO1
MLLRNSFFLIVISLFFLACESKRVLPKSKRVLPKLGRIDLEYRVVNGKKITDSIFQKIPEFRFLNEDSVIVGNNNYKNKIWIAEFFFTSCPTICPLMNMQLKKLHKETSALKKHIQFLSFTIDPENDTPSNLKSYKKRYGINSENWVFLTGKEAETHSLGINNFLTFAGKDDEAAGGYAHSGSFTLVDKEGIVRGVYEVTNLDLTVNENEYKRLKQDIFDLLKYEYNTTP